MLTSRFFGTFPEVTRYSCVCAKLEEATKMISGAFSLIKNFKRQRPNTAAFLCSVFGTVAPCQIVFLALCSVLCRFLEFSGVALTGSSL